jgi:hypothetical protein
MTMLPVHGSAGAGEGYKLGIEEDPNQSLVS